MKGFKSTFNIFKIQSQPVKWQKNKLIQTMSQRMWAVIKAKGQHLALSSQRKITPGEPFMDPDKLRTLFLT